jgi:hypothetical protein
MLSCRARSVAPQWAPFLRMDARAAPGARLGAGLRVLLAESVRMQRALLVRSIFFVERSVSRPPRLPAAH